MITAFFTKKSRLKIRFILKGYRILKNSNQLDLLVRLNAILIQTKLTNVCVSKTVKTSNLDFELSARQYLYIRVLSSSFGKAILYSIGTGKSLRHPLPKEWRSRLVKENIKIDNLSCSFLWAGYIFMMWGRGVVQGLKSVIYLLKIRPDLGRYIYFNQIDAKSLPSNAETHNIVNWYLQWENRKTNIDSISHGVNGINDYRYKDLQVSFSDGLPQIRGLNIIKYILWSLYLCAYSLLFISLKPYSSLLLAEKFKLIRVKLSNRSCIADDILFNNSGAFYRPLWTYEAKEKGARILFYYYSTNIENFKTENGYPMQCSWYLINWPHYLVWDEFQADFIKKVDQYDSIIEVVGPIWFSSNEKNEDIPLNSISVFDITPFRPTKCVWTERSLEYYFFDNVDQFLRDIQLVLSKNNIGMAHKMKRINKSAHKRYVRRVKQLSDKSNYIKVDPSADALQVIQKTKACISMPFTSTALIAKQEGKRSVYYDPTGMIQKDDRAAHGISVLSGINELEEWVKSINDDKLEEICKN